MQLHMLDPSPDDSITFYSRIITLILFIENNHLPMMLWLLSNGEVHCKLFKMQNYWRKDFFQNGGEADWPVKTLCSELVKKGISNFKFLVEESKKEGICIKWLDQQPYHNTNLINNNKFLEYYLLKKN